MPASEDRGTGQWGVEELKGLAKDPLQSRRPDELVAAVQTLMIANA
jgi:hypothetical protein